MASLDTPQISAILVQDSEGERIVAKFWSPSDFPDAAAEAEFEKKLFKKTKASGGPRADAEVLMLEGFTVVFKGGPDITFTVVGPQEENDLMLVAVLDSLWDTMSLLLKGAIEKRTLLAQLELLLLTLDELVEGGVPFELDPHTIESRVMLRGAVPDTISSYNEMTLSSVSSAYFCGLDPLVRIWTRIFPSKSACLLFLTLSSPLSHTPFFRLPTRCRTRSRSPSSDKKKRLPHG